METIETDDGPTRQCGDCTLCCTAVAVFALRKATGKPCPHLCRTGCSVYQDRPRECRDFECLWLRGHFRDDERPDALGVVFCNDFDPDEAFKLTRL